MTRRIIKKPQALRDIAEHFHYIGMDSERAARRFLDETERAFNLIAEMPGIGTTWPHDDPRLVGVRYTNVSRRFRNYLIFFRVRDDAVEVLTILHGMRDLPAALDTLPLD